MRDIKFRGVHPAIKKVIVMNVCAIDWMHDEVLFENGTDVSYEIEECNLMQYTGLKDKNGVEIYEGDIVSHWKQGNRVVTYPMSDTYAGFGLVSGNGLKNTLNDSTRLYEVIGNIHENQELVGAK